VTPPKFDVPGQFVWITRQGQRHKERMQHLENVVELEDVTTYDPESIILMQVKEEIPTMQQGEIGKIFGAHNGVSNPNPETPTKLDETMEPRQSHEQEEVLVEDIIDRPEFDREEEDADATEVDTFAAGQKKRHQTPWRFNSLISQMQSSL
jgi:hypothetical protein